MVVADSSQAMVCGKRGKVLEQYPNFLNTAGHMEVVVEGEVHHMLLVVAVGSSYPHKEKMAGGRGLEGVVGHSVPGIWSDMFVGSLQAHAE